MPSDLWSFLKDDDDDGRDQERTPMCSEEAALHLEPEQPHGVADPGSADVDCWTPADELRESGLALPMADEQAEWDPDERDDEQADEAEDEDLEDLLETQHYA